MPGSYPRTENNQYDPSRIENVRETRRRLEAIRRCLAQYGIAPHLINELIDALNKDIDLKQSAFYFVHHNGQIICVQNFNKNAAVYEIGNKVVRVLNYSSKGWSEKSRSGDIETILANLGPESGKDIIRAYVEAKDDWERMVVKTDVVKKFLLQDKWKPGRKDAGQNESTHREVVHTKHGEIRLDQIDKVPVVPSSLYDAYAALHIANKSNGLPTFKEFCKIERFKNLSLTEQVEQFLDYRNGVANLIWAEDATAIPIDVTTYSRIERATTVKIFENHRVSEAIIDAVRRVAVPGHILKQIVVVDSRILDSDSEATQVLKRAVRESLLYNKAPVSHSEEVKRNVHKIFIDQFARPEDIINGAFHHEMIHAKLTEHYGDVERRLNPMDDQQTSDVIVGHEEVAANLMAAKLMKYESPNPDRQRTNMQKFRGRIEERYGIGVPEARKKFIKKYVTNGKIAYLAEVIATCKHVAPDLANSLEHQAKQGLNQFHGGQQANLMQHTLGNLVENYSNLNNLDHISEKKNYVTSLDRIDYMKNCKEAVEIYKQMG